MDVAPDKIGYPTEKEDEQDTFSGVVRMHRGFDDYLPQPPSCQLFKTGDFTQTGSISEMAILRQLSDG